MHYLFIYYFPQITAVQTMITKKREVKPSHHAKTRDKYKRPLKSILFPSTCQGRVLSAENSFQTVLAWQAL